MWFRNRPLRPLHFNKLQIYSLFNTSLMDYYIVGKIGLGAIE